MNPGSDTDLMLDVYMTAAQREAYNRLRKDAERYRWLRENAGAWEVSKDTAEWTKCETGERFKPRVYFTAFSTGYGGMFLDDAIDAAMKGANVGGKRHE